MTKPKPEHLKSIIKINRGIAAGLRGKALATAAAYGRTLQAAAAYPIGAVRADAVRVSRPSWRASVRIKNNSSFVGDFKIGKFALPVVEIGVR